MKNRISALPAQPLHWSRLRIAVTGLNNRPDNPGPGHAVARCLHESEGFCGSLIGLSYDTLDGGLYDTDIFAATYLLPYPSAGEEALFSRLQEVHRRTPFDVLIPNLDAEMRAFSRLQPRLAALGIQVLIPTTAMLESRDKDKLPDLCRHLPVATPPIRHLTHAGFFHEGEAQGWSYPMVIKGRFYDAQVVRNATEATTAFHRLAAAWGLPVIVQQYVSGEEFNVAAVGDGKGGVLGMVMMRKRALTDKGKAWAGTSILHPELAQQTRELVAALGWAGPLEIEMMCDAQGRFHLLEINPRFPAWIFLSHGAQCNLPVLLLQHLCGATGKPSDAAGAAVGKPGITFIRYAQERFVSIDSLEHMALFGERGDAVDALPPAVNARQA